MKFSLFSKNQKSTPTPTSGGSSSLGFEALKLTEPLLKSLAEAGYKEPTPIQKQAIPVVLSGADLLGIAQTGTGKTAAFCLPILQNIAAKQTRREPKSPRVLILTPTRELAIQIHKNLETYGKYMQHQKYSVIYGGVGQGNQVRELNMGVDVLVATPGRLLDLAQQRFLRLDKIEIFVLDEADRMLDMGFMPDIKRILPLLPQARHSLFFSATMPTEIHKLAQTILKNPQRIEITPPATTVERINQSVLYVEKKDKMSLLIHVLKSNDLYKVLVFTGMKHVANRVTEKLLANGITAAAIHGNKSQGARQKALADFEADKIRVLVATDIASRGIDVDGITHVINFDLPQVAEDYVHRIGRTARAGNDGDAITFCSPDEKYMLLSIEKTTRQHIPTLHDHPFHSQSAELARAQAPAKSGPDSNRRGTSGGGAGSSRRTRTNRAGGTRSSQGSGKPRQGGRSRRPKSR